MTECDTQSGIPFANPVCEFPLPRGIKRWLLASDSLQTRPELGSHQRLIPAFKNYGRLKPRVNRRSLGKIFNNSIEMFNLGPHGIEVGVDRQR